jgi:hypothetical protein
MDGSMWSTGTAVPVPQPTCLRPVVGGAGQYVIVYRPVRYYLLPCIYRPMLSIEVREHPACSSELGFE